MRPDRQGWQGWHVLGVLALALGVGLLFLHEPGFGDDFTYWSFAFDLHERGLKAWGAQSFHNLRWPVWGVCWLWQALCGPGLTAYYGEPLVYLALGAGLAFHLAQLLTGAVRPGWVAALLILFQPLLDSVCHRPMPDLSEGLWGALAVLCWWYLVGAETAAQRRGWMVGLGVALFLAETNRLTGAFFVPVIGALTLCYGRKQWRWVLGAGAVAAACYALEAAWYHHLFGDWLHNLHANMGAKGKKGTEAIALWRLPFRFLGALWDTSVLSPLYALLALVGLGVAWQGRGLAAVPASTAAGASGPRLARVVALWTVLLYLAYACAPQSLHPWRPMIRDADRFLAGLALPMSLLAMLGLCRGAEWWQRSRWRAGYAWVGRPGVAEAALAGVLLVLTARPFFDLGFVGEMRGYLRALPPGTKVFTHKDMRELAFLVDPAAARRLEFLYRGDIIRKSPELEQMAAEASEFWYARKLLWLTTRKRLEQGAVPVQEELPGYIQEPEKEWTWSRLLAKGDTPDLVFYRRRPPGMPPPRVLEGETAPWHQLLPALPARWSEAGPGRTVRGVWMVPPEMRGQVVRVELVAASDQVQAFQATLRFVQGRAEEVKPARSWRGFFLRTLPFLFRGRDQVKAEYLLKPYLHPQPGREFFVLSIPEEAQECEVQVKLLRARARVEVLALRAVLEERRGKAAP